MSLFKCWSGGKSTKKITVAQQRKRTAQKLMDKLQLNRTSATGYQVTENDEEGLSCSEIKVVVDTSPTQNTGSGLPRILTP